jgi:SH3-like domain-containing protein
LRYRHKRRIHEYRRRKPMNKKLFALLLAGLLVASMTACNNTNPNDDTTESGNTPEDSYIVIGTDENGNDVTEIPSKEPETEAFDPSETNPTFVDVTKKVVVFAGVATVRTSTVLAENNAVGWPSEGKLLDVTGESENWYRITYPVDGENKECYIAKTVAADASALDGFTAVEEEVEITVDAVNVRSYPSAASTLSVRGSLKKGTKVTRVAVSENWSRILFEVVSETETDAEGNAKVEIKEYYVSNDCLKVVEAATESTTEAAE